MWPLNAYENKTLRAFGFLVGGIFTLIGLWPVVWSRQAPRLWAVLLGGVLIGLALLWPRSLTHVYRLWMLLGDVLGRVNTQVILSVLFYVLFTPMGLLMRLRGRDPMRRQLTAEVESYRVVRQPRPASHMRHQF